MSIYKTRTFTRWMKKSELNDQDLVDAVKEMQAGLIDADLGGDIYKKRIAIGNKGKSAGVRTIVATKKNNVWFYIFGFEKNVRANISDDEKEALQFLARDLLNADKQQILLYIDTQILIEINHEN
jgi:hypothetical protein